MPQPFHYRHSGLTVASQLELPEWEAFACAADDADVQILLSDETSPDFAAGDAMVDGDILRFAVEGIGSWEVEGGRSIRLHPGFTANPPELRLFTLGSAWAGLGYQRGFAMWHGSAVEMGSRVVLFCGEAGAGKSTMAAAMCRHGARLVGDDLSRIEPGESKVLVYPSSTRLKLWRGAIEHFGWKDRIIQRDYFREDKFHCRVDEVVETPGPLSLAAIVALEEGDSVALERLEGATAMQAVFSQTMFRPEMVEALGAWGRQGALAAQVLASVPAYRLTRPKDFVRLDEACGAIAGIFGD